MSCSHLKEQKPSKQSVTNLPNCSPLYLKCLAANAYTGMMKSYNQKCLAHSFYQSRCYLLAWILL